MKLTVNGKSYTQPIVVKQDPRVKTPALVMQQVYTLSKAAYYGALDAQAAARGRHVPSAIKSPTSVPARTAPRRTRSRRSRTNSTRWSRRLERLLRGGVVEAAVVEVEAAALRRRRDRSAPQARRWRA